MKYIVAGGAGFLGSHFCEMLLKMNNEVVCLDNSLTGNFEKINHLNDFNNFKYIEHDILNKINIESDGIINMACPASPPKYQADPINTLKISFIGTLNLLEIAERQNIKFMQASTSEVYGDPLTHPQNESYFGNVNPFGPRACYDEGKRAAEALCYDFHNQKKIQIRVPRIFNTYGPNMSLDDGRVVTSLLCSAIKNEDINIFGSGNQTRSFCFVDDLIEGLKLLFFNDNQELNSPINLGNPNEITINNLCDLITELTNTKSVVKYLDLPTNDPLQRKPDISKAKKILNWEPKVSLRNGLLKTIEFIESNIQ